MRLALILGWLLVATTASADGGSAKTPLFVRNWQGNTRDFKEVTCASAGDTALVSAAEAANAMSIYFYNTHASNFVTLCPRTAGANQCNDATDGFTLKSGTGFTSNVSVAGAWSCKGDTTAVVVEVYIERDTGTSTLPTPTPLP